MFSTSIASLKPALHEDMIDRRSRFRDSHLFGTKMVVKESCR